MASIARKVLWTVSLSSANESRLLDHAKLAAVDAVCIRSDSQRLVSSISRFHANNIKVYAWRWPAVEEQPRSKTHYFAKDEANFVARKAIPAGLDGYIIDPESDSRSPANNWNNGNCKTLAQYFCDTVRDAAAQTAQTFFFGVTSGCDYAVSRPRIPWAIFVEASDGLFPQTYWRWTNPKSGKVGGINGGNPDAAIERGISAWHKIAKGKPVIPLAGELGVITGNEIADYGRRLKQDGIDQFHFYADTAAVSKSKLEAIKSI